MFSLFLVICLSSNQIDATNTSDEHIPELEDLYPLIENPRLLDLANYFRQNPYWEHGNMPIVTNPREEITPIPPVHRQTPINVGIHRYGHDYRPRVLHPYPIEIQNVHPDTTHHTFLVRHGLYFFTEDDSTSHLLRYGKYQARITGQKINQTIQELIREIGPLTRPIRLISSTQTRAFETLYNIRLQLNNDYEFRRDIIQDSGLTECVNAKIIRKRWIYFVREYLQPIKSENAEHTVTIIAAHGYLLTAFDDILRFYIGKGKYTAPFRDYQPPRNVAFRHAEARLYRSVGVDVAELREIIRPDEIPLTFGHGILRADIYYHWAGTNQCRSSYGRREKEHYIEAGLLENIFNVEDYQERLRDIVHVELKREFLSHILPMMRYTCRQYLYHLQMARVNTDFGSFNELASPIPIPATAAEQSSRLPSHIRPFSPYAMPFPVDNSIQKIQIAPSVIRPNITPESVHPESRVLLFLLRSDNKQVTKFFLLFPFYLLRLNVYTGDARTSYLTRLGIHQIYGIMDIVSTIIEPYVYNVSSNTYVHPVNIVAEPSIAAAESCFHVRKILSEANYHVSNLTTDLTLQYNYFQNDLKQTAEFFYSQRIQISHMIEKYLSPDTSDTTRPSLKIHILCGEGRLFTAFRQELALANLLMQPYDEFSTNLDQQYNMMQHGNTFLFEIVGDSLVKSYSLIELSYARNMASEEKIPTEHPIELPKREIEAWYQSPDGPCTLSYYLENIERLSLAVVNVKSLYQYHIAELVKKEWYPYLAGLFIYSCRLQLTLSNPSSSCDAPPAPAPAPAAAAAAPAAAAVPNPDGDHSNRHRCYDCYVTRT